MQIQISRNWWKIREAMELLCLAARGDGRAELYRSYLWRFKKTGKKRPGALALQEELLALCGRLSATERLRKYFAPFSAEGLECVGKCLVRSFDGDRTDTVGEMKKKCLDAVRQVSLDCFPPFESMEDGLGLQDGPGRRFADSMQRLDLNEEQQGRLLLTFSRYEQSMEEIGELVGEALSLLEPFWGRLEEQAEELERAWSDWFLHNGADAFFRSINARIDVRERREAIAEFSLVNGAFLMIAFDQRRTRTVRIRIGFLMMPDILQEWHGDDGRKALSLLADETKREILEYIKDTPHYGREIADRFRLTTATISYHMNELYQEGLVGLEQQGKRTYYRLDRKRVSEVLELTGRALGTEGAAE
ncbi:MAG: winged helix-turn-helix domain-containing protein [Eubacteriales bacterium]|nr:winged helix-turn-helix domain-containing protein [Eubacteriales bacterium]